MSRIITQLPLDLLWKEDVVLGSRRTRWLEHDDIRELLRRGPVEFVVASVGHALRWIPADECFSFWKRDASLRIGHPDRHVLEDFPGGLAYIASEWTSTNEHPVILLECHH